jgi:aminotransferase
MEKEDLEAVAAVLRDTNIMVVSDEIYSELTYNDLHHVSIATIDGMYERTIVLNGFSKSFAMTGWRQGYLCGPAPLVEQMVKIHQYTMLCAPSMGQAAALSALENAVQDNYADVERMKKTYNIRRRMLLAGLKQIGLPCFEPKGAFYAFPDIRPTGLTSEQFCDEFLMQQHVACVPGTAFGASGEGFIRISYATATRDIERALEKMDVFVKKYRG